MDSGFRALRGPGMTVTASCTVSRSARRFLGAALAMLDRRRVRRRHKARIDVAEAAVAGDHLRRAFLDAAEFAVPHHVAGAEILHCAPWRIAEAAGVGGANAETQSSRGQYRCGLHGLSLGRREGEARRGRFSIGPVLAQGEAARGGKMPTGAARRRAGINNRGRQPRRPLVEMVEATN
jgi:hypothetical protein